MSDKRNDGGPAFIPVSLRDFFAAAAMQGLVTFDNGERLNHLFSEVGAVDASPQDYFAAVAYSLADAMLRERERKPTNAG